jgi:hypothetical protein
MAVANDGSNRRRFRCEEDSYVGRSSQRCRRSRHGGEGAALEKRLVRHGGRDGSSKAREEANKMGRGWSERTKQTRGKELPIVPVTRYQLVNAYEL